MRFRGKIQHYDFDSVLHFVFDMCNSPSFDLKAINYEPNESGFFVEASCRNDKFFSVMIIDDYARIYFNYRVDIDWVTAAIKQWLEPKENLEVVS